MEVIGLVLEISLGVLAGAVLGLMTIGIGLLVIWGIKDLFKRK